MTPERAPLPDGGALSYVVLGDLPARGAAPGTGGARACTPILLHRPLGGSMTLWGEVATRLAAVVPVILFDPRGVGRSSAAPIARGTRDMARDALELLDSLGVRRAHLLGLSLGGMVASWMAIDAPERVDRLVLVSTLPRAAAISTRLRRHLAPLLRAYLRHGSAAEAGLVRSVLSRAFRREHAARVREIERLVRATPTSHRSLLALSLAALRHDASDELRRIAAPTLLLFGGRDYIVGRHARDELAGRIPGAVVEIISDAGHDISLEKPRLLADRVLAFLD